MGKYHGPMPPYGYMFKNGDKTVLFLDKEVSGNVRFIFDKRMEGEKYSEIAKMLNEKEIETPTAYLLRKGYTPNNVQFLHVWNRHMVKRILFNPVYAGIMANHKTEKIELSAKSCTNLPRKEWIYVPDTHEAIVTVDELDKVMAMVAKGNCTYHRREKIPKNIFRGKIKCGYCGRALRVRSESKYPTMGCTTPRSSEKADCYPGQYKTSEFEKLLLQLIHREALLAENTLKQIKQVSKTQNLSKLKSRKKGWEEKVLKIKQQKMETYESFVDGNIAKEEFLKKKELFLQKEHRYKKTIIGYIWYEAPEDEKNFTTLLEMINASEAREDDPDFQSPVDLMFERLEEKDPEHFAVRQYKKFLLSAGKTRSSILISCGARLAPFDIRGLRELLETDEMELDTLGDRKTALFVIISDTDDTFNFVVSILYTQLFNLLCDKADDVYGGRLPVHVRCLLDEFANIGQIPKFEKLIATIRSREISASIILQSQSQLKAIYKDNADTIVGNCDTTLFLGGKEKTTLKEMSELLGKETIDSLNTSETRGRELSHGLNYQKLGKQLMSEDEIAVMDGGKCILQLRGVRPFFSDKYDITKHPKYKYLSDYDKKNAFDIERYMKRRPAIVKPEEPFDCYEISEADLQEDKP